MATRSIGGRFWLDGGFRPAVVHVDDAGRIAKVARSARLKEHVDLGDRLVLPGAIDIHVHFREPGHTHKEDLTSGSTAAAFGGVTGFVDMPNTVPATSTSRALEQKIALAGSKAVIDYAFWAGGTWFTEELPQMLTRAAGVKTYLGATTGDLLLEDPDAFAKILRICGEAGKPLMLHCEAQRVLDRMKRTEVTVQDHDLARPPMAEVEAVYDVMKALAGVKPGGGDKPAPRVHVAHAASKEAVQAARSAHFSVGACPHHLLLDTGMDWMHGYGKVNPPMRGPAQREALWGALVEGKVQIVESDHAPHTRSEKEDNFHASPAGLPGVETMLPLLLAAAAAGRVPMERVVTAASRAPAELLGLPRRGRIEEGAYADLVAVDLDDVRPVRAQDLHSKAGWTPFEGMDAVFPSHVFVRGRPVVEAGDLVARPGDGADLLT